MDEIGTYNKICSEMGYDFGLVSDLAKAKTPNQRYFFSEALRQMNIDALYFSGEIPVIYFKFEPKFNEIEIAKLHKLIWNQSKVPFLFIITPGELKIYNCFEEPANISANEKLDEQKRLIKIFNLVTDTFDELKLFSKAQIDTGEFLESELGETISNSNRIKIKLLNNIKIVRKKLYDSGLKYPIIHNLIGRSIFILYLEDRGSISPHYYKNFNANSESYLDLLKDVDATYKLYRELDKRFNGNLFPIIDDENSVSDEHLQLIRELFLGTDVESGQRVLWRPYDFSIVPIELISEIYEEFLHIEDDHSYVDKNGIYFTPHPLVEFIMNEVLPWPSEEDHKYNLKILDPACGSGIFLVEAYRRLIERWKFSHINDPINDDDLNETLKNILINNIFGIDKEENAIKVAAFSLYLSFMDYLKPKTIWEKLKFPYLIYNQKDDSNGKSGNNLFPMSTFIKNAPYERDDYDIVVGNPPWKRDDLDEDVSEYCSQRGFAQEIAQAFLWRARDFSSNGEIALIAKSKILFNSEKNDKKFRDKFIDENYVESIINLSSLRRIKGNIGKQLFKSSRGPAAIYFYRKYAPRIQQPTVLYCTPKPNRIDNALPYIIIDPTDIKHLPRDESLKSSKIWKVAMWGTERDLEFVNKYIDFQTIKSRLKELKWSWGRGYQLKIGGKKCNELNKMLYIPTEEIDRFWINGDKLVPIGDQKYSRFGVMDAYNGPHLIIKTGQKNKKFCASYSTLDFAFKDVVFGIHGNDDTYLKALMAYLNSSFANYMMFLTSSSWGIEREKVNLTEVLTLPGIIFEMKKDKVKELAIIIDDIINMIRHGVSDDDEKIKNSEKYIDKIIYEHLGINKYEQHLIDNVLNYSIDFFNEGELSEACNKVNPKDLEDYAKIFCESVNSLLKFTDLKTNYTVYIGNAPLCLVTINFEKPNDRNSGSLVKSTSDLESALNRLDRYTLQEFTDSIYIRRYIKIYEEKSLHIVKPNEKRYWSKSIALQDADEAIVDGIHRGITNA